MLLITSIEACALIVVLRVSPFHENTKLIETNFSAAELTILLKTVREDEITVELHNSESFSATTNVETFFLSFLLNVLSETEGDVRLLLSLSAEDDTGPL